MRKRKPLKSKSKIPDGKKFKDKYQVSSIIDSLKEIKGNKTLTENQKNKLVSELLKNLKE